MYFRRIYIHPKYAEDMNRRRFDRRPNAYAITCKYVRVNKLHKLDLLQRNIGKGHSLSRISEALRFRGCLSVPHSALNDM